MAGPNKIQAKASQSSSASVSAVGNLTGSPVQNNVLLAVVVLAGSNAFGITPPAGWAAVSGPSGLAPGGTATGGLYWKKAGAAEPSTWTWTATGGTPSAHSVTVSEWTGAENTTAPQFAVSNFSASPFNTPTLLPTVDNCAIIQCLASVANLASATTGFGFPAACTADDSTGTSTGLGIVVGSGQGHDTTNQGTAVTTTARSCTTNSITPAGGLAYTVALHPAPSQGLGTASLTLRAHEINSPYVHPVQAKSKVDSTGATTALIGQLDHAPEPGNKLLALIGCGGATPTLTPPAGWTQRDRTVQPGGNGVGFLFEKTAGAAEPATWTWTASVAPQDYIVEVIEIDGASTTAAQVAVSTQTSLTQASTPALTTTRDGCLVLQAITVGGLINPGPSISSYPAGVVQDVTASTANAGILVYNTTNAITHEAANQEAAGPTSAHTFQYGAIATTVAYTVAVEPDVLIIRSASLRLSAHGFRPTLKKWLRARDAFKAGTGAPAIVCVGDSITEGFYAGPNCRDLDMWPTQLGRIIGEHVATGAHAARYMPADVGPHDITNTHGIWPEYNSPGTAVGTSPWASTATPAIGNNTFGLGARCLRCSSAQTISIAGGAGGCPSWATHAVLGYSADGAGALFTIRSNGSIVDSFTTTGAVTAGVREIPITPGTTFAVEMPANSYLEGVKWLDKAHGSSYIQVLDAGHGGYAASQYDNGSHLEWAASVAAHNPVLVILGVGGNDIQAGRTAGQFQTNLSNMVTAIDAKCVANGNSNGVPDYLIFAIPFQGDGVTITVSQWNAYVAAMAAVASGLGVDRAAFIDTQAAGILPASFGAPDQYRDDGIHPNVAGSTRYAQGFGDFLMSSEDGNIGTPYGTAAVTLAAQPVTLTASYTALLGTAALRLAPRPISAQRVNPPENNYGCTLTGLPTNILSWSLPDENDGFAFYEIQRYRTSTGLWEQVATLADINAASWVDEEPAIGVEECYRLRIITTEGFPSPWTEVACGTVYDAGCGYYFSSNWLAAALGLAYADVYKSGSLGNRAYTFPEGDQVSERTFYNRPDVVAFRSLQPRGVRFTRDLSVSSDIILTGVLPAEPLLALARQPVPYICVRDESGNRFYANIRVHSESHARSVEADFATVTIEVVSVAEVPTPVIVSDIGEIVITL